MTSIAQRQELQNKIWKIANDVRGSVDGWDFKQFVLGTLFYRFISENFTNYIEGGDESIDYAKLSDDVITPEIKDDAIKTKGYFIEPTILLAKKPDYITLCEEIFGPVLTIYVYEDADFDKTLDIVDKTGIYALTGSIISQDRYAIDYAMKKLVNAAGNFYINDKCTGAVVGQQPFGGARGSGTNDKAGSMINLLRWVSPRTIKETFVPPVEYTYPFLDKE